jgi:cell division septation protein DedD
MLVLALVAGDPALAAPRKKKKGRVVRRPAAAAPVRAEPPPPSVRQGVELWRAGKWDDAVKMWQPFAEKGDADAMFNLGQAYKLGRGVELDKAIARDWYRRAAVKAHLPAQANLGILLFQAGEKPESVRWLKSAADRGEMRAQYVLGIVHWNGDGAGKSMPLAYAYLVRAAAQGLPEATKALNELSQVIQPIDRANGWQVATALANSNSVPAQFQSAILPPPMDAPTTPPPPVAVVASAGTPPQPGSSPTTAALNAAALSAASGDEDSDTAMGSAPADAIAPPPPSPAAPVRVAAQTAEKRPERAAEKSVEKPVEKPKPKAPPEPKETGWRIQLGSYPTERTAMAAWTKLAGQQKQEVKGLKPKVSRYGSLYRLQVGPFPTRDRAQDGCKKLEIGKNGCFAIDIGN